MHCKLILLQCITDCVCVSFGKMDVTAKCYIGLYKDYKCNNISHFFVNTVSELPEDGRVVLEQVGVIEFSNVVYTVCKFGSFSKKLCYKSAWSKHFYERLPSKTPVNCL